MIMTSDHVIGGCSASVYFSSRLSAKISETFAKSLADGYVNNAVLSSSNKLTTKRERAFMQ